ncbi:hypothetical protein B1U44_30685 (plasmid) [Klebsiella pneumoniae subsp. pneumoniae]|nr:hypothetical protein B1U44_30685 [Klebsiella pneumoniae subsp. pneumoniae]
MHGAVFNVPGSVWIIIWIFAGSDIWICPVDNWISCPFNFERKQNLSVQFPGASSLTRGFALSFGCGEHYWLSLKSEI